MQMIRRFAAALFVALGVLGGAGYAIAQLTPVPALPDTERRTEYTGVASSTGPFSVGFALYGDGSDYQNWVQVYVNGALSTSWTMTSQSGVIGNIALPITDAQITFSSPQTGTVEIVGARRSRRTSQLSENRGVSAHDFNVIITDIIAQLREAWDQRQNRVLQVPPGETVSVLPPASSRANTNLIFDSQGKPTTGLPASGTYPISTPMAPIVGAASVASAASQLGVSAVPVGTMLPFAGYSAPANFDFAYGQAYSRSTFPALLAALTSSQTGTCTASSTTITGLSDTSQFAVGQRIEGSSIPSLTNTIAAVLSSTSIQVAAGATSSGSCTVQVFPYGNGDGLTTFNLPDARGYAVAGRDNMGGTAASRLTSTYFGANPALGVAGGSQSRTLLTANLPPYTPAGSVSTTLTLVGSVALQSGLSGTPSGGAAQVGGSTSVSFAGSSAASTFTGTAQGGTSTPVATVSPMLQLNYIVRVLP